MIGKEEVWRWGSKQGLNFLSSIFTQIFLSLVFKMWVCLKECNTMNACQERLYENVMHYPHIWTLSPPGFHSTLHFWDAKTTQMYEHIVQIIFWHNPALKTSTAGLISSTYRKMTFFVLHRSFFFSIYAIQMPFTSSDVLHTLMSSHCLFCPTYSPKIQR